MNFHVLLLLVSNDTAIPRWDGLIEDFSALTRSAAAGPTTGRIFCAVWPCRPVGVSNCLKIRVSRSPLMAARMPHAHGVAQNVRRPASSRLQMWLRALGPQYQPSTIGSKPANFPPANGAASLSSMSVPLKHSLPLHRCNAALMPPTRRGDND